MKYKVLLLNIILFLVLTYIEVNAKNYVKIATIGAVTPSFDEDALPQDMVDGMIDFWTKEFQAVLSSSPDLIVLPEACDRPQGLSWERRTLYFAALKNQLLDFFSSVAKENHCYIAYGSIRYEAELIRNSCVILDRKGEVAGIYDKNFPTIGEMEYGIVASDKADLIKLDFGTVGCAICFDLNFEELLKKYEESKPDIILFSSNYHGGLAQSNWAYAARAYFVGSIGVVNLPSEIRNPFGEVVATSSNYFHYVVTTINLDYRLAHLDYNWAKFRALKKKYKNKVTIYDPGEVGSVMVISEDDDISAEEMIREFDIELLDDYFERSRTFRKKPGNIQ